MKNNFSRCAVLSLLLLASSCIGGLDKVRLSDFRVDNITFAGTSTLVIDASVKVVNPTSKKLKLQSVELDVSENNAVFAHLRLTEPAEIPAKFDDYQPLKLELKITNMLALMGSSIDIHNPNLEQFTVDGSLKVKAGISGKTITVKEKTFEQLLKSI